MSSPASRPGRSLLEPALRTARALDRLSAQRRAALRARLEAWLDAPDRPPSRARSRSSPRPRPIRASSPGVRALAAMLADAGGRPAAPRDARRRSPRSSKADRHALHRLRVRLGPLDVFVPPLLKPAAQQWRAALARGPRRPADAAPARRRRGDARRRRRPARRGARLPPPRPRLAAHRPCRPAREPRPQGPRRPAASDPVDRALATSLGLDEPTASRRLMDEDRLRPRRRRVALARPPPPRGREPPPRRRQRLRRAGQAQALAACGSTAISTASGW